MAMDESHEGLNRGLITDAAAPGRLVTLAHAALRLRDRLVFSGVCWEIDKGEHWAVVGPNGAGKSTLVRALAGEIPVVRGAMFPDEPAQLRKQAVIVSFEKQRGIMAREERGETARYFRGDWDGGIRVRDLLRSPSFRMPAGSGDLLSECRVERLIDRRIRDLSSGEMRRVQIAVALAASPQLLILDEPFEALDAESRSQLADIIEGLMDRERAVVLVTHRRRDIVPNITHVLGVKDGRVVFQGPRTTLTPEAMDVLYSQPAPFSGNRPAAVLPHRGSGEARGAVLIDLRNVRVCYGGVAVFENLNWTVREGEHWAIYGPNGSGKTTLLRLIVGDHPQAYANAVWVFGQRRGSGSSIRDLRKQIGFVSSELQIRYDKEITAVEAVMSGFFASIGLYRHPGLQQMAAAGRWMDFLGIRHMAKRPFRHLSQGEQRMVLLARALVASPRLLVLDEPCQGLDRTNRRVILNILDQVARAGGTTILYVTHHLDEMPACVSRRLSLMGPDTGALREAGCKMSRLSASTAP